MLFLASNERVSIPFVITRIFLNSDKYSAIKNAEVVPSKKIKSPFFISLIAEYGQEISSDRGHVKFYTDINEGGNSKVKIEAKSNYQGESEITIVLVYNVNNILIAYKMETEIEIAGQEFSVDFEIKPWNGLIRLPNDLDSYKAI